MLSSERERKNCFMTDTKRLCKIKLNSFHQKFKNEKEMALRKRNWYLGDLESQ